MLLCERLGCHQTEIGPDGARITEGLEQVAPGAIALESEFAEEDNLLPRRGVFMLAASVPSGVKDSLARTKITLMSLLLTRWMTATAALLLLSIGVLSKIGKDRR